LTTLGWLKYLEDPYLPNWEQMHLRFLHKHHTVDWHLLQGGVGDESLNKWLMIMRVLEFDRKAMVDLVLLAQSGLVGRTTPTRSSRAS
jgi:hypothetical protein